MKKNTIVILIIAVALLVVPRVWPAGGGKKEGGAVNTADLPEAFRQYAPAIEWARGKLPKGVEAQIPPCVFKLAENPQACAATEDWQKLARQYEEANRGKAGFTPLPEVRIGVVIDVGMNTPTPAGAPTRTPTPTPTFVPPLTVAVAAGTAGTTTVVVLPERLVKLELGRRLTGEAYRLKWGCQAAPEDGCRPERLAVTFPATRTVSLALSTGTGPNVRFTNGTAEFVTGTVDPATNTVTVGSKKTAALTAAPQTLTTVGTMMGNVPTLVLTVMEAANANGQISVFIKEIWYVAPQGEEEKGLLGKIPVISSAPAPARTPTPRR